MNITECHQDWIPLQLDNCSIPSTSTDSGTPPTPSLPDPPTHQNQCPDIGDQIDFPLFPCLPAQNVVEQQQTVVDVQPYLAKRKIIMGWLQRYGSHFRMSRNAQAAAQQYADIYFHNHPFQGKKARLVLTCLLILASKHCDYKILYTAHIAYLCDIDHILLNKLEIQCCRAMGFDFSRQNYVTMMDQITENLKIQTGFDLYCESEDNYVKLRMIHSVVERMYCQLYEWEENKEDIVYIFKTILTEQIGNNFKLWNYFLYVSENEEIKDTIFSYINCWRKTKQNHIRQQFRKRKTQQNIMPYEQFSTKYWD